MTSSSIATARTVRTRPENCVIHPKSFPLSVGVPLRLAPTRGPTAASPAPEAPQRSAFPCVLRRRGVRPLPTVTGVLTTVATAIPSDVGSFWHRLDGFFGFGSRSHPHPHKHTPPPGELPMVGCRFGFGALSNRHDFKQLILSH